MLDNRPEVNRNKKRVPVTGYPMYTISDHGDVTNTDTDKVFKPKWNGSGLQIELRKEDDKSEIFYVHELVATHFIPNPKNLRIVVSEDGDKSNCRVDNLRYEDQRSNVFATAPVVTNGAAKKAISVLAMLKVIDELVGQIERLVSDGPHTASLTEDTSTRKVSHV